MIRDKRISTVAGGIGGLMAIIGAFLPWVTIKAVFVGEVTRSGVEGGGDGLYTFLLALGAMGVIAWYYYGQPYAFGRSVALAVLGAILVVVAIVDIADVEDRVAEFEAETEVGIASVGEGLYLTLIGGLILAAAGVLGWLHCLNEFRESSDAGPSSRHGGRRWLWVAQVVGGMSVTCAVILFFALDVGGTSGKEERCLELLEQSIEDLETALDRLRYGGELDFSSSLSEDEKAFLETCEFTDD